MEEPTTWRRCFREPIPQIEEAARHLDEAVSAHLRGESRLADQLIRRANIQAIWDWSESIWGKKKSLYVKYRPIANAPKRIRLEERAILREPTTAQKLDLRERDGFHCRFCGIPVIRDTVRERIRKIYPDGLPWPRRNEGQHAAFQAMWVQYDHLLPHSRGGDSSLDNMVIACAPCNFGRARYTLEEVGLIDPTTRDPVRSTWDGLERFRLMPHETS